MKITDVKVTYLKVPVPEPGFPSLLPGLPPTRGVPFTLVRVYTDEGITGIGGMDGRPFAKVGITGWRKYIDNVIKPILTEEIVEPFYIEKYIRRIRTEAPFTVSPRAACVEMALWDIVGKTAGLPVYKLLGAYKDKVKAYVSARPQYPPWTPKEWADFFVKCREEGYRAVKMFVVPRHSTVKMMIEIVKTVRDTIGDEMGIMVDAVSAWGTEIMSFEDALKLARGLERYDVNWLEEPLHNLLNPELSARLADMVDIPIAGGGLIFGIHNYRMLLEKRALDVVQPDAGNTGLLEVKRIAEMAEMYGKSCSPHMGGSIVLRATLQIIGSTNIPWCESSYLPPVWTIEARDCILKEPTRIDNDGYIEIPKKPGLGIELNEKLVAKYTVHEKED